MDLSDVCNAFYTAASKNEKKCVAEDAIVSTRTERRRET